MLLRFDYQRPFDSTIEDFLTTDYVPTRSAFPAMDVVEQENETIVIADLPGVKKEDVKITLENKVLTISGTRKPYAGPEKSNVLLKEICTRDFSRSVRFGFDVDSTKMSAEMNNGVLTITLPKAEAVKAKEIPIQ